MKLPLKQRRSLFAGQVVELALDEHSKLRQDGVYAIHNENGTNQGQFRVLVVRKNTALIRLEADPVRLLSRTGGGSSDHDTSAYTDFPGRALGEEPEAVDEFTQKRLTEEARERDMRRKRDQEQEALDREATELRRERNSLEARLGIARKVAEIKDIDIGWAERKITKDIEKIERRLDLDARDSAA